MTAFVVQRRDAAGWVTLVPVSAEFRPDAPRAFRRYARARREVTARRLLFPGTRFRVRKLTNYKGRTT